MSAGQKGSLISQRQWNKDKADLTKHRDGFWEYVAVIKRIHDTGSYTYEYGTFSEFASSETGLGDKQVYKLIQGCEVRESLSPRCDTIPEENAHLLALSRLESADDRVAAVAQVQEQCEAEERKPTTRDYRKAVTAIQRGKGDKETVATGGGDKSGGDELRQKAPPPSPPAPSELGPNHNVQCPRCRGAGEVPFSTTSSGKFVPPTIEEVQAYCDQRGKGVNAQKWWDFYQSKDWMVGKNKMKDWRAGVRTWEGDESPAKSVMDRIREGRK